MVVHGENGFIFDPHHPEELAEYMEQLIKHPDLIKSMGERSQQLIQPYNPSAITSNLAKIVHTLQS